LIDVFNRALDRRRIAPGNSHVPAALSQCISQRLTEAAGGTGDQDALFRKAFFESVHVGIL